jgi:hypothetical protein
MIRHHNYFNWLVQDAQIVDGKARVVRWGHIDTKQHDETLHVAAVIREQLERLRSEVTLPGTQFMLSSFFFMSLQA